MVRGAWSGLPRHERVCKLCGVLDDEVHFLLECNGTTQLRNRYLPAGVTASAQSAVDLLRCTDTAVLNNLSKYIQKCFQLRKIDRRWQGDGL